MLLTDEEIQEIQIENPRFRGDTTNIDEGRAIVSKVLSKILKAVDGARLTDKETMKALYPKWLCTDKDLRAWLGEEEYRVIRESANKALQAQLQAIKKAIKGEK